VIKITKEMVKEIHEDLILRGGRVHGTLCDGTLDYIIDKIEMEKGVYKKAAWALFMSRQHPFFDGNKRTAFMVAHTILRMHGYYLGRHDEDEIFEILHKISDAKIDCDIRLIERWLKKKSHGWWKAAQRSLSDYR
jgi:death-on-curing protein